MRLDDFIKVTSLTDTSVLASTIFGYDDAQVEANSRRTSSLEENTVSYTYLSSLRINRDHTIGNQAVELTNDFKNMLESKDFVGFFKACGPNFITSIKRALEITTVFKFYSYSEHKAEQFAAELEAYIDLTGVKDTLDTTVTSSFDHTTVDSTQTDVSYYDLSLVDEETATVKAEFAKDSTYSYIRDSLEIIIYGYGLKLDPTESEMLVVSSLEEHNKVLHKILKNSQHESLEHAQTGRVYEIEVEQFVDNQSFQTVLHLDGSTVDVPVPQSSIDRAYRSSDTNDFDFDPADRGAFTCADTSHKIDKYGYCCASTSLYNRDLDEYDDTDESERVCRPLDAVQTSVVKEKLDTNGEFVGRLDLAIRHRSYQLATLEHCAFEVSTLPSEKDYYILRAKNGAHNTIDFTLAELKNAIDPNGNYGLIKHMTHELDEYTYMFLAPCLAALSGSNLGIKPNTDNDFFMTHAWDSHAECLHTSCLSDNMRWNRQTSGGCISSVITGPSSDAYDESDFSQCIKDVDSSGSNEVCRYSSISLNEFRTEATNCWTETMQISSIDDIMDSYCAVELSSEKVSSERESELSGEFTDHCPKSS